MQCYVLNFILMHNTRFFFPNTPTRIGTLKTLALAAVHNAIQELPISTNVNLSVSTVGLGQV